MQFARLFQSICFGFHVKFKPCVFCCLHAIFSPKLRKFRSSRLTQNSKKNLSEILSYGWNRPFFECPPIKLWNINSKAGRIRQEKRVCTRRRLYSTGSSQITLKFVSFSLSCNFCLPLVPEKVPIKPGKMSKLSWCNLFSLLSLTLAHCTS